ncbi:MAG: aminotransferase class I/II-fold pyridoxal phosphate-dependent enzyme [Rhodanobacteraceae bacterium]
MSHMDTLGVHAGREDLAELGVHAPPLDLSTTYPVRDLETGTASFDALVGGQATAANPIYARLHNPTVARFENALAQLEGTSDAVAFGSGMAALSACLLAARQHGDHVLAVRPLYGTSDHLLNSRLLGLRTRWVKPEEVAAAINADTALVIIETPANPTLKLVDIAAVVRAAGQVPVLVDSTFATPVLQQPARLGASLVMHSATKFLGGHGDVIAGVVATNSEWAASLRQVRAATGGLLHPLGAYLLHRGLQTLSLRVLKAQDNAQALASRLLDHPGVASVSYPGISSCDPARLVAAQMHGPGCVMAFEVHGGKQAAAQVMAAVRLATPAVSLGSVDTLIQHPAGLTHRTLDETAQRDCGITPGLLRLSVGIEHLDDIWADLEQALASAQKARAA